MIPKNIGPRLSQIVPGQESLTMNVRINSGGDSLSTTQAIPRARRRPVTRDDLMAVNANIGETVVKFQIYDTGLTYKPQVGNQLVDTNGITYEIRSIDGRTVQNVYNVICMQDK